MTPTDDATGRLVNDAESGAEPTPSADTPGTDTRAPHVDAPTTSDGMPERPTRAELMAGPRGISIASMIFGIASLALFWTLLPPIIGFLMARYGYKKQPAGRFFALTGLILNGVALAGAALVALYALVLVFIIMSQPA